MFCPPIVLHQVAWLANWVNLGVTAKIYLAIGAALNVIEFIHAVHTFFYFVTVEIKKN